jgi:hypothetical protein
MHKAPHNMDASASVGKRRKVVVTDPFKPHSGSLAPARTGTAAAPTPASAPPSESPAPSGSASELLVQQPTPAPSDEPSAAEFAAPAVENSPEREVTTQHPGGANWSSSFAPFLATLDVR